MLVRSLMKLRSLNGNERIKIFQQIFKEYDEVNIKTGKIERNGKIFPIYFLKTQIKIKILLMRVMCGSFFINI